MGKNCASKISHQPGGGHMLSHFKIALFYPHLLLLTSYISVFVGLVIMDFLALFYLIIFNENNVLITCWSFTLDR